MPQQVGQCLVAPVEVVVCPVHVWFVFPYDDWFIQLFRLHLLQCFRLNMCINGLHSLFSCDTLVESCFSYLLLFLLLLRLLPWLWDILQNIHWVLSIAHLSHPQMGLDTSTLETTVICVFHWWVIPLPFIPLLWCCFLTSVIPSHLAPLPPVASGSSFSLTWPSIASDFSPPSVAYLLKLFWCWSPQFLE